MLKGKPRRLDLIYVSQPLYFVTFCTLHRSQRLATNEVHENFRGYCLDGMNHNVAVGRYVIMPDHIHLFVRGSVDFRLGVWIRGLKRALATAVPGGDKIWEPGFFDHILRSDEGYAEKWNYVRDNPVRAGLAESADEWPYQGEIVWIDRT
jgi:putative transposase